jgi:hypothetical protein
MSKEYENIDALFKAELGGSAVKAPAYVKANVDKALGFGSGKKLAWIILPLLILLVASPFIYHSFQAEDLAQSSKREHIAAIPPNSNSSSSNFNDNSNNESYSSEIENKTNTSNSEFNSGATSSSSTTTNLNLSENLTISSSTNQTNAHSTVTNKTINTSNGSEKSNPTISYKPSKNPEINNLVSDQITTTNTLLKNSNVKTLIDSATTELNNKPSGNIMDSTANQPNKIAELINPETKVPETKNPENKNLTVAAVEKDTNPNIDLTTKVEIDSILTGAEAIDTSLEDVLAEIQPPAPPYKSWLLSLTTGVNFKNSAIVAANPSDSAAYSNTIIDKIGHSASFGAQYRLRNSLTFGAGLGYSTQIENYNFYKSEITSDSALTYVYFQDSIPDSVGWIYFQDSTQEYSYTSSENVVYNANGKNINTYLHIPISLGTQLRFNKIFIDLFAQGRFNLLLISKSTYVENDQLVVTNLAAIKRSYFDLVLGTNIHYNIFNNLYLTGTVRYRPPFNNPYYVNGMTNRFANLHLGIGISLNL